MPNGLISILATVSGLLVAGYALGLLDRKLFSPRWLLIAAALFLAHDALLTDLYGAGPDLLPASDWNWQGKFLALILTLGVAAHPVFGFKRSGLTLQQGRSGRKLTYAVAAITVLIFAGLAMSFPNEAVDHETLAFQLTLPGLEEEPFYRGVLLLALNEAFRGRVQALGIGWGWGALLTSLLFGLDHAMGYSGGAFTLDPLTLLLTGLPALLLVWFRERTGSLVLPILLHNFANSIFLLI
jgi:uncharacterized protein